MRFSGRIGSSGWPVLEWAIVLLVAALVSWLVWLRVDDLQEEAEQTKFSLQLEALRTGLRFELARQLLAGQLDGERLATNNPVGWLQAPPPGYVDGADQAQPGDWYFDTANYELVYLPLRSNDLQSSMPEQQIRLKVFLPLQSALTPADKATRIMLCPVQTFRWQGVQFNGGDSCQTAS